MADEVAYNDGLLVDFGDRARIERRFRPEQEPILEKGKPVLDPISKKPVTKDVIGSDGAPIYVWVAYEKVPVEPNKDGKRIHPVLGQETTHTHVWMIRGQGTEAEARAIAKRIAG